MRYTCQLVKISHIPGTVCSSFRSIESKNKTSVNTVNKCIYNMKDVNGENLHSKGQIQ